MAIEKELLDQLLAGREPAEVFAKDGLVDDLKKALSERILNAELDNHLEGERDSGGMKALEEFESGYWGQRYPAIALSWRRNWEHVAPFFAFPEAVRRIVYTTDEIDKHFFSGRGIIQQRGRPRGEAWCIG